MKIYVGNLSYDVSEDDLRAEFAEFGQVESVAIPVDKYSGQPRGFAFIEMPLVAEGQAAVAGMNGKILKERTLTVNEARPPENRGGGRSFGNNKRGGGNSRGGYRDNRSSRGGGRPRRY
jgi:RNA recognition motif-containing protein